MGTEYVKVNSSIPTATFLLSISTAALMMNSGSVVLDRPAIVLDENTTEYYTNTRQTTYTNVPTAHYTLDQVETLHAFASNLLENIEDLDPEFSRAIDDEFWNLV